MTSDQTENTKASQARRVNRNVYLVMGLSAVAMVFIMGYSLYSSNRIILKYMPLVDAAMEIKLEASTAHLWFEEIASGDRHENIDVVLMHIDEAKWYANAMLEGGRNPKGVLLPLDDPLLREEIKTVVVNLDEFREITLKRYEALSGSGAGSEIDQRYDKLFRIFLAHADEVEKILKQSILKTRANLQSVQVVLMFAVLLSALAAGYLLYRSDRQRAKYLLELEQAREGLKKALVGKDMLIKEVHHRVKNNLSVIQSLLNLQSMKIEDESTKGLFNESQNRVQAMSMIHERLYQSPDFTSVDFPEYVRSLVTLLYRNYKMDSSKVTLEIEVPEITLDIDTIIPCGLIINELVSNAFKYAFPEGIGELYVGMEDHEGNNILVVKDDGIGLPGNVDINHTKSLGMQIVQALSNQLGGAPEIVRDKGTEFRIVINEREQNQG